MTETTLSRNAEDYLKQLYLLHLNSDTVTRQDVRQALKLEQHEAVLLRQQLEDDNLLVDDPHHLILTDRGEAAALNILFRQSESVENFLKAVYTLQQPLEDDSRVSTNALKDALSISAPSVTDMAQRLVDDGLIDYRKYYGVRLTDLGRRIALKIIRRHRLIELYLVRELNYRLHEVHEEAEALEHAVSDRFIRAISEKLGNPSFDPHGDPIPGPDGTMPDRELEPLSDLPLKTRARVSRLVAADPEMLQHTQSRGLILGTVVTVLDRDPFEGPLRIQLGDDEVIIGYMIAGVVLVERLMDDRG